MWGNLKKMLMLACLSLGAYTTYLMVNDNAQKKAQKVNVYLQVSWKDNQRL